MRSLSLEIFCKVHMSSPPPLPFGEARPQKRLNLIWQRVTLNSRPTCFHLLSAGLERGTFHHAIQISSLIPIHTLVSLGFADAITYQMFWYLTVGHQTPLLNVYIRRVRLVLTVSP